MKTTRGRGAALAVALVAGLVAAPAAASAAEAVGSDAVQEARTKLFGPGWDDPGVVRMRPAVGNTTVLVSYGGTVILHDSTIEDDLTDVGSEANNNGSISLEDVIAAKPTAILQDHTHFDQHHNAVEIAASGVPLVTDLGGCIFNKETAIEKGVDPAKINCNLIRDAEGKPFFAEDSYFVAGGVIPREGVVFTDYGTKGWPTRPIPGIDATALQIKHTTIGSIRQDPNRLRGPEIQPGRSLRDLAESYQGATPSELATDVASTGFPFDLEGSNVAWLVRYDGFSMFHHGSTGTTEPGADKIAEALRNLGSEERVDIETGGVAELTFYTNGAASENNVEYSRNIGAKMFMPTHHYNWYPVVLTSPAATYFPEMTEAWAGGTAQAEDQGRAFPEMCYLTEENYSTVFSFNTNEWKGDNMGQLDRVAGPGCYTG